MATASTVLAGLDQFRERAFAERDASLLAHVYAPGELLRQDTDTLKSLVAPDCVLTGARTSYRNIQILSRTGSSVQLQVAASLAPSVLACGGAVTRTVAGIDATQLRIELTRTGSGGYLIDELRPQ